MLGDQWQCWQSALSGAQAAVQAIVYQHRLHAACSIVCRVCFCITCTFCIAGDLPNGTAGSGTASAAAVRGRCRVVVMLQRLVARLHTAHAAQMPPAAALQLVGVLQVRCC